MLYITLPVRPVVRFTLAHHPTWEWRRNYEPEVVDVISRFVKPGQLVVDGGANIGFFTLMMSKLVGDTGSVIAFEPEAEAFRMLNENLAANDVTNVVTHNSALWEDDREMEFWEYPLTSGYSSFHKYIESVPRIVKANKLDTLLDGRQPNFIKIDCEGADECVLRGAERILRQGVDCVCAEINFDIMHHFLCSDRTIRDYMQGLGYDCYLLQESFKPTHIPAKCELIKAGPCKYALNMSAMFVKPDKMAGMW